MVSTQTNITGTDPAQVVSELTYKRCWTKPPKPPTRLHDRRLEAQARAGLITALWKDGDKRRAAVEYGFLTKQAGDDITRTLCPDHIIDDLEAFPSAIAEGRARATGEQHPNATDPTG